MIIEKKSKNQPRMVNSLRPLFHNWTPYNGSWSTLPIDGDVDGDGASGGVGGGPVMLLVIMMHTRMTGACFRYRVT